METWNLAAELMTGYKAHEVLGKHIEMFFVSEDRELNVPQREIELALRLGKAEDSRWHLKKDGSRFWAVGAMTSAPDGEEGRLRLCKIFRDDSIRKETETQMMAVNAELNRFAGIAAHDLQQPLRTVTTFIDLALRRMDSSTNLESQEHLKIALDACARMRNLIRDLLAASQTKAASLKMEPVDMGAVVQQAVANLRSDLISAEAVVSFSALPILMGNASQLAQLFQNLVSNAIKYRRLEGETRIQIDAKKEEAQWIFSVKDNGTGIEGSDQQRIFGEFQRGREGETRSGLGLGLSICKSIVEHHKGRIWVESQVGDGSTFFISLPSSLECA